MHTLIKNIKRFGYFLAHPNLFAPKAVLNFVKEIHYEAYDLREKIHAISLILLASIAFCLALICALYSLIPVHPNGDEIILSIASTWVFWMNATLALTAAGPFLYMLIMTLLSAPEIYKQGGLLLDKAFPDKKLESGFSIAPDVLIWSFSERDETFEERAAEALKNYKPWRYVIQVQFRNPITTLTINTKTVTFDRETPAYLEKPIPVRRWLNETYSEYQQYINELTQDFPEWSASHKAHSKAKK